MGLFSRYEKGKAPNAPTTTGEGLDPVLSENGNAPTVVESEDHRASRGARSPFGRRKKVEIDSLLLSIDINANQTLQYRMTGDGDIERISSIPEGEHIVAVSQEDLRAGYPKEKARIYAREARMVLVRNQMLGGQHQSCVAMTDAKHRIIYGTGNLRVARDRSWGVTPLLAIIDHALRARGERIIEPCVVLLQLHAVATGATMGVAIGYNVNSTPKLFVFTDLNQYQGRDTDLLSDLATRCEVSSLVQHSDRLLHLDGAEVLQSYAALGSRMEYPFVTRYAGLTAEGVAMAVLFSAGICAATTGWQAFSGYAARNAVDLEIAQLQSRHAAIQESISSALVSSPAVTDRLSTDYVEGIATARRLWTPGSRVVSTMTLGSHRHSVLFKTNHNDVAGAQVADRMVDLQHVEAFMERQVPSGCTVSNRALSGYAHAIQVDVDCPRSGSELARLVSR